MRGQLRFVAVVLCCKIFKDAMMIKRARKKNHVGLKNGRALQTTKSTLASDMNSNEL